MTQRVSERPRDLLRAQEAMRPHVLREQWRSRHADARSMPLREFVAEWSWHTGAIPSQAAAHPVRVTKGTAVGSETQGIAAGEIIVLHCKVKDRILMCRDVYGQRFIVPLSCTVPFVKLMANLTVAPRQWPFTLPVADVQARHIASFTSKELPVAVAFASDVVNNAVPKDKCIVLLSAKNDPAVFCSSQREAQSGQSLQLRSLPLSLDVHVCAAPPSETHHQYDVSWGGQYDTATAEVTGESVTRVGHKIDANAQRHINARIAAARGQRNAMPASRSQPQQQHQHRGEPQHRPSAQRSAQQQPQRAQQLQQQRDETGRRRWSLFGGKMDGERRAKKKNKKNQKPKHRSSSISTGNHRYPASGHIRSSGQSRVMALPPMPSSHTRGIPTPSTGDADGWDDDDDYERPVPMAGRSGADGSSKNGTTHDGYMAPRNLSGAGAEDIYSTANAGSTGPFDPHRGKTATQGAQRSNGAPLSSSSSSLASREQQQQQQQQQQQRWQRDLGRPVSKNEMAAKGMKRQQEEEEVFGFGFGGLNGNGDGRGDMTLDLEKVAERGRLEVMGNDTREPLRFGSSNASLDAHDDADDGDDDVLLQSLSSVQLKEKAEPKQKPKSEHIYGVRKDLLPKRS